MADVDRGRHAEAAHEAGREVGKDVAEHVFGHHDVEAPGVLDEVESGGVDVAVAGLHGGEQAGALVEDAAEEDHGAQHVGLVDAGQQIGRASCRERVCQYVSISVVAVSLKKKNKKTNNRTN